MVKKRRQSLCFTLDSKRKSSSADLDWLFGQSARRHNRREARVLTADIQRYMQWLGEVPQERKSPTPELVAACEDYFYSLTRLHHACAGTISWPALTTKSPPFSQSAPGPREQAARRALEAYKPSVTDRVFGQSNYKMLKLEAALDQAILDDKSALNRWIARRDVARKILVGNLDIYEQTMLQDNPFEELLELGNKIEVAVHSAKNAEVTVAIDESKSIPAKMLALDSSGKVFTKNLSEKTRHDYLLGYVCSLALRIARELFALLPLNVILVHVEDERQAVLSVRFKRAEFSGKEFNALDAYEFVGTCEHRLQFKRSEGLHPVEKLSFL